MPIRTKTYDLEDEYDRISDELSEARDEAEGFDTDTPHYENARANATELSHRQQGLAKLAGVYPDVTEVTIGELSPAEYAALEKHLPDEHTSQEYRTVMTAVATVEAPYVEADVEATIKNVLDNVPPYYTRWVAARADELLRADGVDENPFSQHGTEGEKE